MEKENGDIFKATLDIDFERDRSNGLGSTYGDRQTDRQTDTQTHTHTHFLLKLIFRMWEWYRIENPKKKLM